MTLLTKTCNIQTIYQHNIHMREWSLNHLMLESNISDEDSEDNQFENIGRYQSIAIFKHQIF